jgi:hypothetical protein
MRKLQRLKAVGVRVTNYFGFGGCMLGEADEASLAHEL